MCRQCSRKLDGGRAYVDANRHGCCVRNVMTCPVAGLNPDRLLDGTEIVRAINHLKCWAIRPIRICRGNYNIAVTRLHGQLSAYGDARYLLVPAYHDLGHDKCFGWRVGRGQIGIQRISHRDSLDMFVNPAKHSMSAGRCCTSTVIMARVKSHPRTSHFWSTPGANPASARGGGAYGRALPTAGVDARAAGEARHIGIFAKSCGRTISASKCWWAGSKRATCATSPHGRSLRDG